MAKDEIAVLSGDYMIAKADIAETVKVMNENLAGQKLSSTDLVQIKLPSGKVKMFVYEDMSGSKSDTEITGIILHAQKNRVYWEKSIEDGGNAAPDCASIDGFVGVRNMQSDAVDMGQGGHCEQCPLSMFGSDTKTGRGQACKEQVRLFILRADKMLPDVVSIPPTSLGAWKKYLTQLTSGMRPYHSVVTTIGLQPDKNAAGTDFCRATFKIAEIPTDATRQLVASYREALLPALKASEPEF